MDENPYQSPSEIGYRSPPQPWFTAPKINWRKLFFAAAGTFVICVGLVFLGGMAVQLIDWIGWLDQNIAAKVVFFFVFVELVCLASAAFAVLAAMGWLISWLFRLVRGSP